MEQPKFPNSLSRTTTTNNPQRKKPPKPQELISHYKTQGLDQEQASIKVIEDLQSVLFRVIASNSNKKDRLVGDTSKKIDVINNRLAIVDLKIDTKPGYVETFALGISSGAALNGMGGVWPHVLKGIGQIWSAVRTAADPSSTGS